MPYLHCDMVVTPVADMYWKFEHRCRRCGAVRYDRLGKYHRKCGKQPEGMDPVELALACPHRGPKLDEVLCELCGQRHIMIEVNQCALFGKCTLKRWRVGKRKHDDKPDAVCFGCESNPLFKLAEERTDKVD